MLKSIVELASTTADERFLKYQTRFYEEEHFSASLARTVAEVLKLVRVQKGKLLLTKKGSEYLTLTRHQQFIVLFNIMFGINLGYFDGHQKASCVHNSSWIMEIKISLIYLYQLQSCDFLKGSFYHLDL